MIRLQGLQDRHAITHAADHAGRTPSETTLSTQYLLWQTPGLILVILHAEAEEQLACSRKAHQAMQIPLTHSLIL